MSHFLRSLGSFLGPLDPHVRNNERWARNSKRESLLGHAKHERISGTEPFVQVNSRVQEARPDLTDRLIEEHLRRAQINAGGGNGNY